MYLGQGMLFYLPSDHQWDRTARVNIALVAPQAFCHYVNRQEDPLATDLPPTPAPELLT